MNRAMQEQLHVVHIIPTLTIGGAERFVVSLCNQSSGDVRHSVVTLWDDAPLAAALAPQVQRLSLHIDQIPKWQRVSRLSVLLESIEADVVHTHLFSADLWGRLAARRSRLPVVTTEHNINHAEPWHWRLIKRAMRRYTDSYTAPSQAVATYMRRAYGIRPGAVQIIPHGIDTAAFGRIPAPTLVAPYTVLLLGRLVPQKGHRVLLDALTALTDLPVHVHIVGSGPLAAELEAYATERGVADRITWQSAVLDVAAVYEQADIVVVPSLWEGFGLVALEAMASGRAVVASDIDGLREFVTDGETGVLVKAGDSTALAQSLRSLVGNPDRIAEIGVRAKAWATVHGDVSQMAARYTELYHNLVR